MKEFNTDVHIIGAGLIGLSAALALCRNGYKIIVSDKDPQFKFRSTLYDNRTVAISEGTKKYLVKLNIWNKIKLHSESIRQIKVIDRNKKTNIDFENKENKSNLGYIVKNNILSKILLKELINYKNFKLITGNQLISLEQKTSKIISETTKITCNSDLLIAADGKNSTVKKIVNIPSYYKNYNQSAVVICFYHQKSHENTAYEFFYDSGPLAILPMKKEQKYYCSSIVWSNNNDYSKSLINIKESKLISLLNDKLSDILGNITKINSRKIFPLSTHIINKFYSKNIVFVGDAAHSVHPIAGQGWNLGMRDVFTVDKISKKYKDLGIEIGNNNFCKEYHENTFYDSYRLYQITDKFDSFFRSNNFLSLYVRRYGFNLINRNKKLKNFITDFAMGI